MTTTAEILQKARDLISDEKNWTQGAFARDAKGRSEAVSRASCFCSVGAIAKAAGTNLTRPVPESCLSAPEFRFHAELARFNDSHSHAEVIQRFDRAIKRAISAEEA